MRIRNTTIACPAPHQRRRRRGGMAVLEMALVLPLMLYMGMGMVEYGQFFYVKNTFQQAARDACRESIRPDATRADPATAATRTLGAAGIAFQASWMTIVDLTAGGTVVSDVSTVPAGDVLRVTLQTTYGSLPSAVRPLSSLSASAGIPSSRAVAASSAGLKE